VPAVFAAAGVGAIGLLASIGVLQSSLINSHGNAELWFAYVLIKQAITVIFVLLFYNPRHRCADGLGSSLSITACGYRRCSSSPHPLGLPVLSYATPRSRRRLWQRGSWRSPWDGRGYSPPAGIRSFVLLAASSSGALVYGVGTVVLARAQTGPDAQRHSKTPVEDAGGQPAVPGAPAPCTRASTSASARSGRLDDPVVRR